MSELEIFKTLTGCNNDSFAQIILDKAQKTLLSLTKRSVMIPGLETAKMDLAIVMYNRLGTEGESSRSEGGISISFTDMPKSIQDVIKENRLAKVGGHAFENEQTETSQPEA